MDRTLRLKVTTDGVIQCSIDYDFFGLDDDESKFKFYVGKTIRSKGSVMFINIDLYFIYTIFYSIIK